MTFHGFACAAICCAFVLAEAASAKTTLRQSVNLTDMGLSTEGGEVRLYRVERRGGRFCRIEAVHYGETGKATLLFEFGATLFAAERSQYRYGAPIYVDPNVKVRLDSRLTLKSREGRKKLGANFLEYKSYFPTGEIARCARR